MIGWEKAPLEISDYDNPETIRFRKYATGAHLLLEANPPQTGRTPREVVWRRGKARLYRYAPGRAKEHPVPVLFVYALILRPYVLDLVPQTRLICLASATAPSSLSTTPPPYSCVAPGKWSFKVRKSWTKDKRKHRPPRKRTRLREDVRSLSCFTLWSA